MAAETKGKVLAVDDEAHIRRLVQINLQALGFTVETAGDGVEALERIRENQPDLLVLDITMPRMDGVSLIRKLNEDPATSGIRVILLTARAQDADIHEAERLGVDWYLHKPFSPIQLREAVTAVMARDG